MCFISLAFLFSNTFLLFICSLITLFDTDGITVGFCLRVLSNDATSQSRAAAPFLHVGNPTTTRPHTSCAPPQWLRPDWREPQHQCFFGRSFSIHKCRSYFDALDLINSRSKVSLRPGTHQNPDPRSTHAHRDGSGRISFSLVCYPYHVTPGYYQRYYHWVIPPPGTARVLPFDRVTPGYSRGDGPNRWTRVQCASCLGTKIPATYSVLRNHHSKQHFPPSFSSWEWWDSFVFLRRGLCRSSCAGEVFYYIPT